ncbi:MAG: hypothetical protein U0746_17560 [Gemmataceae bacterium]
MTPDLEAIFPGLHGTAYRVTSPNDSRYNCVAWAAGDTLRWWWPDDESYWPPTVPREETVAALEAAFASLGYAVCADVAVDGAEYVAVFVDTDGRPRHAARRLPNGSWTSKLGEIVDIEHELHALNGVEYGTVARLLRRAAT